MELRRGVVLVVNAGTTLFASRDAKLFDTGAGKCGTVTDRNERACKPLIYIGAVE